MQVTVKVEWPGGDKYQTDCDPDNEGLGDIVRVLLELGAESVMVERAQTAAEESSEN